MSYPVLSVVVLKVCQIFFVRLQFLNDSSGREAYHLLLMS